mgnify:CR=1 FL=1
MITRFFDHNYKTIDNQEARELLNSFFHFSYNVYGIDKLITQLEEIQEKLPVKGGRNTDFEQIEKIKINLRACSQTIHEIMGATYSYHVKQYMDECNR